MHKPGRLRLRLACWATHLAGAGEAVHRVGSTLSKGFPCARQAAAELFSPIFPRALGEHGINKYHSRSWTLNFLRKRCWWQTKSLDFFRPVHSGSEWSIVFGLTGPSCPFYMSSGSFQLTLNLPLVNFSATSQKATPLFSSHMGFALNHRRLDKVFISKVLFYPSLSFEATLGHLRVSRTFTQEALPAPCEERRRYTRRSRVRKVRRRAGNLHRT